MDNSTQTNLNRAFDRVLTMLIGFWFAPASDRSYGMVRIGFAVTSFLQLVVLWPHRLMLIKTGMIDGSVIQGPMMNASLFHLVGSETLCTVAFLAFGSAMLGLAAGVFARAMIAVVSYWHLSLYFDLAPAMSGYDHVLRLMSLILLISPLGLSLSAPSWWRSRVGRVPRLTPPAPAYGLRLMQWQLACIYFSTVWLKVPDQSWRNGEFISYFLMSLYSNFPSPRWASWSEISALLTLGTLVTEVAVPILLWQRRWRWLGLAMGIGLHVGIALTSDLWLFSLSMMMVYPAYLEADDVSRWSNWVKNTLMTGSHARRV